MRRVAGRRGVTLLELLLTITLLALVGAMVTTVIVAASRVARRATTHLALERTTQTLQAFLGHELRDADWGGVSVTPAAITLPRAVGSGAPCEVSDASVVVPREAWDGDRAPEADRDLLLVLDNPFGSWREAPITAAAGVACPDGRGAWRLASLAASGSALYVRVEERVVLRRYRSGAADWLGLAPAGGATPVQPFAGPLLPETSRFARVGDLLQVELGAIAGSRALRIALGGSP